MNLAFIAVFSMSTTVLAQIRCAKDVTLGGCQATRNAGEHFPNKDMKHWRNDGSAQGVSRRWADGAEGSKRRLRKQAGTLWS